MLVVKIIFIFMKGTDSQPSQSTKKQRLGNPPTYLDIYTWNPNDPCFEWKGPSFGGFKPQNRGQTGYPLPSSWHTEVQVLKSRDVPGEAQTARRDFPTLIERRDEKKHKI